jgi:hypothetical protein
MMAPKYARAIDLGLEQHAADAISLATPDGGLLIIQGTTSELTNIASDLLDTIASMVRQDVAVAKRESADPQDACKVGDPDPTPQQGKMCRAVHEHAYICTRKRGHAGQHVAGAGSIVVAVWR